MARPVKDQKRAEKHARRVAAREEAERLRAQSAKAGPSQVPAPPDILTFKYGYGSPGVLAQVGPLLEGAWEVPTKLSERLRAVGRPVPPRVGGYLLVDTGAVNSCIAMDVANELNLQSVGLQRTRGSSGEHDSETFEALLRIQLGPPDGSGIVVLGQNVVVGIPDLDKYINPTTFLSNKAHIPKRLIGLIGRDVLRGVTLTYRGNSGLFEISVERQMVKNPPRGVI